MERTNLHNCYGFTQNNAHSVHSVELGTMETHLCLSCTSYAWILLLLKRQNGVSAEKWFLASLCSLPSVLSTIVSRNLLLFTHLILISVLHSHSSAFPNSTSLCLVLLHCMVHGENTLCSYTIIARIVLETGFHHVALSGLRLTMDTRLASNTFLVLGL